MGAARITDLTSVAGGRGPKTTTEFHQKRPLTARGVVAIAPPNESSAMEVLITTVTGTYSTIIPAGNWAPRGSTLPAVGDDCLVVYDDIGDAFVPVWAGTTLINASEIGGNAVSTLAPTDGQVLAWNGAVGNWQPSPEGLFKPAKAYWAGGNGVGFTSGASLPFDTVAWDATGGDMKLSPTYGFQAPVAGYYFAAASICVLAAAAGDYAQANIGVNSTVVLNGSLVGESAAVNWTLFASAAGIVKCAAGDVIKTYYGGVTGQVGSGTTEAVNNLMVMRVA